MEKSRLKEVFIAFRDKGEAPRSEGISVKRAYKKLKSVSRQEISDNFYLIDEGVGEVKGKRPLTREQTAYCRYLLSFMTPQSVEDDIAAFFEVFGELSFFESEAHWVREGLISSAIWELSVKENFDINILRALLALDFTPFLLGYNKSEQILRKDAVYLGCDRETRALYRKKILTYARRRAIGFPEACRRLVDEAQEKGCHIGELLDFQTTGKGWLIVAGVFFVSLLLLFGATLRGRVGTGYFLTLLALSLVPLWQGALEILTIPVSRFKKPEILPRLDLWKIPEEYATLSVIASLASSTAEVEKILGHLELLSLKTQRRGRDEYAYWGLLLDLPESSGKEGKNDGEIIGRATERVRSLNRRYGDKFVLFTRERTYDEEKKKYVPHERKRGAIVELVKLLRDGESAVTAREGVTPRVKYMVVLDSDTDMELGALNKMVGTMAHPLNTPKLSKRGGAVVVSEGFGVLQPAILTNMSSSKKSRFASLLSGVGGIDFYHSSIFNLNNALFGEGIFCGKGILDIDAFHKTLTDTLPDNIILSHDILEGTRLRAGYLPDVRFFDSVPSNVIAYYKRAHRWARGDVQLLKFLPRRVNSLHGKIDNPLLPHQKFVFLQNFIALTDPVFKVLSFLVIMRFKSEMLTLSCALLLLPQLLPFFRALARALTRGRISDIARRFFTDSLNTIIREFVIFGYYLSSLPFVSVRCADAIIRSLWRMFVSHKRLLEWNTASQSERASRDALGIFLFTLPSALFGVIFILGALPFVRLLGILSLIFPIVTYYLSKPRPRHSCPVAYRGRLTGYSRDMWRYFDKYVDKTSNFLPPDNVSLFPSGEVAYRTSPTNIGLYLLCVLASLDFSFINLTDAVTRLERAVESIEKMKKYRGHLYNWYNILNLEVIGDDYVSTVDSGNFTVALVALYEGLLEYEKSDRRVRPLCERIKAIELGTDFRALFNSAKGLFHLGYFVGEDRPDSIMYDMYMSEMRSTDYYAIGRGTVRENHWSALSRPITSNLFGVGMLSWSGTAFEYFMPHLLLPVYKNSFAEEALSYTFAEQVKHGARVNGHRFFGISESGYYAFDEALGYQYRAFGVPTLSRRRERTPQMVYSPYSTFLMMRSNYHLSMRNLESLKKIGMYGECGFYEAIDLTPSRTHKPAIVKSFMSHHVGMSLIASANAVFDDIFVRRFMNDAQMSAVGELLKEAVPVEARNVKGKDNFAEAPRDVKLNSPLFESSHRSGAVTSALTGRETSLVLFERGVISLDICFDRRDPISAIRPLDSTHTPALFLFANCDGKVYSPTTSPDVSVACSESYCEYRQGQLKAGISLSAKTPAVRIKMEASAKSGEVGLYFEPLLCDKESFLSHPAFSNLFIKSSFQDGVLVMTRVYERPYSMALFCTNPYTFEYCRENLSRDNPVMTPLNNILGQGALHLPISPCVFAKSKFRTRTDTTFVIGFGKTPEAAIANGKEELLHAFSKSRRLSSDLFYSALVASGMGDFNRDIFEALLQVFRPSTQRTFKTGDIVCYGKGGVYSLGISGNYPVFLIREGVGEEMLKRFFLCHKLHYIMGLRYEVLVEVTGDGYFKGTRGSAETLLLELGCSFMLSKSGGIHLVNSEKVSSDMLTSLASAVYPDESRTSKYRDTFYKVSEERVTVREAGEREFVIDKSVTSPPLEWHHIIASRVFGTMLSHQSLGNTWVYNSGLSRLTYWENDSIEKKVSETVIMEKDGELYDLVASAGEVRFGCGEAEYRGRYFSIGVAIHPTLMFKAVRVSVENSDLSLFYRMLPTLDARLFPTSKIEYRVDKNAVVFKNVFSESFKEGFGYLLLPFESVVKISDSGFGVHCERGGDVVFVLGYAHSQRHYDYVKKYFEAHRFSDVREASTAPLTALLKNEKHFFITYQTLVSRFFARSGPYQSSGAWGFRDQAQDCLALLDFAPHLVRSHIARLASHQYLEGDVQHWWHSRRGVRTNCSDDYLWFVWLASVYVLRTGDRSILDVKVPCLISTPLTESEKDRYEIAEKSAEKYTILEHMRFALVKLTKRGVGAHGLPFILSGDWNDSMNMLPQGSESVWLGFFARIVIFYYEKVTGDESFTDFSLSLRDSIEKNAFFSDRYARAFLPDGRVLGVEGSEYFEIDSLPQSFASLCHRIIGDGNVRRITLSLNTAWNNLYDGEKKIWRLFTPPVYEFDRNIGYLSAYPAGVRENGGQYTHAAVWAAEGFLYAPENQEENRKRAETIARIIYPETHKSEEYKAEPYVLAGDVYTDGHGGWSWYTGSASWYRDLILRLSDEKRNIVSPFS